MFHTWLKNNNPSSFNYDGRLFPKASDREFWNKVEFNGSVEAAENFLDYDWPMMRASQFMAFDKMGNRVAQEKPHFERRSALATLIEGELCEYKGRFIPEIVDGIFLICEETSWGLSAHHPAYSHRNDLIPRADFFHIDLFSAETASMLGIAYHLFYDEFMEYCPGILERIEFEIDRRIVSHYLTHVDYWWMGYERWVNNWNPWIIANILTAMLTMEYKKPVLCEGINKMLIEIQSIMDRIPEDGGCDEGPSYWGVSGAMIIEFCYQLYLATNGKINFFGEEKLEKIALYEAGTYAGNGHYACFADGIPKFAMKIDLPVYLMGKFTGNPTLCTFAKEVYKEGERDIPPVAARDHRIRRNLYSHIFKKEIMAQGEFVPAKELLLKDTQLAFLRENGWYLAVKGGYNEESHNHNDVANFLVYKDNKPVLIDAGCGTYTKQYFGPDRYSIWSMQTKWHNLPLINGEGQPFGKEFRSDSFDMKNGVTEISFASAYPASAGVSKAFRSIEITGEGIELSDSFEFIAEENTVTESFITLGEVEINKNSVIIDKKYILEADSDSLIRTEYLDFEGDIKLVDAWESEGLTAIRFEFALGKENKINFRLREI